MQCFRKFPVAKKFMDKRGTGQGGRSITIFRRKFFVSVPKNFAGEPFCAISEFSASEKVYG